MDEPAPPTGAAAIDGPDPYPRILYETARILAESATLAEAAPRMLEVCRSLGWQFGSLWEVDRARNLLRSVGMWQPPSQPFREFAGVTLESTFPPGIGLPGRVWASREPAWIPDVTRDTNFPRAPFAERSGLHAAFALPIGQGTSVLGVMEFFNRDILQPTPELLAMMTTVGRQIGLFVARKWADEELDRFFTLARPLRYGHRRRLLVASIPPGNACWASRTRSSVPPRSWSSSTPTTALPRPRRSPLWPPVAT
jgi:GAF domain-containing protein